MSQDQYHKAFRSFQSWCYSLNLSQRLQIKSKLLQEGFELSWFNMLNLEPNLNLGLWIRTVPLAQTCFPQDSPPALEAIRIRDLFLLSGGQEFQSLTSTSQSTSTKKHPVKLRETPHYSPPTVFKLHHPAQLILHSHTPFSILFFV